MLLLANLENSLGDFRIPFSEETKYCILGISVAFFLIGLCFLIWQSCRYCRQPNVHMHNVNGTRLHSMCGKRGTVLHSQPYFLFDKPISRWQSSSSDLDGSTDSPGEQDEEKIQGSLRFSVFYDQQQAQLVVTVLEARNLALQDPKQCVDLVVKLRVLWEATTNDEEQQFTGVLEEWQTQLVQTYCNALFEEKFFCWLAEEDVPRVTLCLEVQSFDKYSRQCVLGEVRVSLKTLNMSCPLELMELNLQKTKKDTVGKVLLSLKYMPTSHRLEVGILKIRTCFRSGQIEKVLYASIKVLCRRCRIRHQRTSMKIHRQVTVFNEVLTFKLSEAQISKCILMLSVYELLPGKKSSKRLIGQLSFGKKKNEEDEHWKLMMNSLRQPVAKWHLLNL